MESPQPATGRTTGTVSPNSRTTATPTDTTPSFFHRFMYSFYYLPRRSHIFLTALRVYLILKSTQLLNKCFHRTQENTDRAWASANNRAANLVLRVSTARRGLWIKCCQYLAARSDALPPEYARVLSKSLDDCPPTPGHHIIATIMAALATSPAGLKFSSHHNRSPEIDDFFTDFDATHPLASASIAQVHTATERATGARVVLKVQHPHIRPMLLQDLADLRTLLAIVAGAEPKFDLRPLLDAWIDMVPLETDFDHERGNQDDVRAALAGMESPLATSAYVPKPLPQYSSDKLLVMEYIDGRRVSDIISSYTADPASVADIDRERLVVDISKSFAIQLFICNVFSGDPHPGNFLVRRNPNSDNDNNAIPRHHPVLLDFGICVDVSPELRAGFCRLILAAVHNDSYTLLQSLVDVGVKFNRADPVAALDVMTYILRSTAASRDESMQETTDFRADMKKRDDTIEENARQNPVMSSRVATDGAGEAKRVKAEDRSRMPIDSFPGYFVFFFRSIGMLRGLAVSLNVKHSYLEVLRPYAEHALLQAIAIPERLSTPVFEPVVARGSVANRTAMVLKALFEKLYNAGMMVGMQVAVYQRSELVLSIAAGRMGRDDHRPVREDTVFNSFSTTKGLTAILFASVQDEYGVEYDDLVTKYWPEYGQNGKADTTVGHILSHTAGLAQTLPDDMSMLRLRDDWEGIIRHFETSSPSQPPGSRMEYHALSFGWLVAGLIMKITGRTYQEHLRELTRRLGIEDECFCGTMPDEMLPDVPGGRVAALTSSMFEDLQNGALGDALRGAKQEGGEKGGAEGKGDAPGQMGGEGGKSFEAATDRMGNMAGRANEALKGIGMPVLPGQSPSYMMDLNFYNHAVMRSGFMPSANGHFSARAIARLYSAMSNDGMVGGERVLEAGRAAKMCEKRVEFEHRGRRAWGAGLTLYDSVLCGDAGADAGEVRSCDAVGHGGIGGSFAFAVPREEFAMAVTVNKLNIMSAAAAAVIAATGRTMGVAVPEWYNNFGGRVLGAVGDEERGVLSEKAVMERMLKAIGTGKDSLVQALVG